MCQNMVTHDDILTLNFKWTQWQFGEETEYLSANRKLSYLNGSDALRQKPFKDLKGEEFGTVPTNLRLGARVV